VHVRSEFYSEQADPQYPLYLTTLIISPTDPFVVSQVAIFATNQATDPATRYPPSIFTHHLPTSTRSYR
jgi:hypothetical protein